MKLKDLSMKADTFPLEPSNAITIPEMEEMAEKLEEFAEYCRFRNDSTMCVALHTDAASMRRRIEARKFSQTKP